MYNNQDVVNFLNNLAIHGSAEPEGVCVLIDRQFSVNLGLVIPRDVYDSWEHFSGDYMYPVPSPHLYIDAEDVFYRLPKWEGKYGKFRRNWCRHLAEYFSNVQ